MQKSDTLRVHFLAIFFVSKISLLFNVQTIFFLILFLTES